MQGIVLKSTGSRYTVKSDNELIQCIVKGKMRLKGNKTTNPVAVGDVVDFTLVAGDSTGAITNVHERKNYIIRKSVNLSRQAHIIASNIDVALLLVTVASPPTTQGFIDRFLVAAEAFHIPVVIVFNKIDLYTDEQTATLKHWNAMYTRIGYKCLEVSAIQQINLDAVRSEMQDKVCLLSGNSGVGKSTLVNVIDEKLNLRVGEISDYHHKGKHTTTFAEMFELSFGGYIIDTPGIKGFGIVDIEPEELALMFPEMFRLLDGCKFYNCTHLHEPGCAVKAAVEAGEISHERYESYFSMFHNDESKYRQTPY